MVQLFWNVFWLKKDRLWYVDNVFAKKHKILSYKNYKLKRWKDDKNYWEKPTNIC